MESEFTSTAGPVSPTALLSHTDWIRSLARRLVRDAAAADDLTQETLLAALRGKPRDSGHLRPWLAGIARNLARTDSRKQSQKGSREAEYALNALRLQDPMANQAATLGRAEAHRSLVDHVLSMPEPTRSLLLERYFEGRRPAEMAKLRGVSPAVIHSGLTRAHTALREKLERQGGRLEWLGTLGPILISLPGGKAAIAAAVSSQVNMGAAALTVKGVSGLALGVGAVSAIAVTAAIMTLWHGRGESVPLEEREVIGRADEEAPSGLAVAAGREGTNSTDIDTSAGNAAAELAASPEVTLATAQETDSAMPPLARVDFSGRCLDDEGVPVAQQIVELVQAWDGRPEYWGASTAARSVGESMTDANGGFTFEDVEVGSYVVGPRPAEAGASSWLSPVKVKAPAAPETGTIGSVLARPVEPTVTLRGGHWISGVIERGAGMAPHSIRLTAFRDDVAIQAETMSSLDGTFQLGPLAEGSYTVTSVGSKDVPWAVASTTVTAWPAEEWGISSTTLRAVKAQRFEGRVKFDHTVAGAVREGMIRLAAYEETDSMETTCIAQATVAADGSYRITGLEGGLFFLSYESRDGQHVAYQSFAGDVESLEYEFMPGEVPEEEEAKEVLRALNEMGNVLQASPSVIVWLRPDQFRDRGPLTVKCVPWVMEIAQFPVGPFGPLRIVAPLPRAKRSLEEVVFKTSDVTLQLCGPNGNVLEEWPVEAAPTVEWVIGES